MKLRWRFGIVAGIFLAIFCLYPQFKMLYLRGDAWNGHYAYNDIDEVAYGAYLKALIDGRPRKNDPYTGRDESPETPQPESLFSIQFAAPYSIAIPARLFGIGAPWAMTLSGALAGFLAALAAFWVIGRVTGNSWYAMAGALVTFAGGALAAGEGALPEIVWEGFSYPYFPGFRRYIPAMAMPAIFAMFGLAWKLLSSPPYKGGVAAASADGVVRSASVESSISTEERTIPSATTPSAEAASTPPKTGGELRGHPSFSKEGSFHRGFGAQFLVGMLATLCFAYCVYSYFYIWTTAAAWLVCLAIMWVLERPVGWRRDLKALGSVGLGCVAVLVPYAWLLSNRSQSMDDVQLLVHTRVPDLFRVPEYISFAVLMIVIYGLARGLIGIKDRSTLFTLSLALVPIAVFNQQVVTGRSLQPIHYQVFIGNYVAAFALVMAVGIVWRKGLRENKIFARAACLVIAVAAIVWGFVECHYTVRVLDEANIERDEALPLARRLAELAKGEADPHRATVLAFDGIFADDLPTVAPQNVLWARHQHVFAGLSWQESKERYYQFLYYSNVDEKGLDYLLKNDFVSMIALFGWGRHTDRLSFDAKPLTYGEIAEEVKRYGDYVRNFGPAQAANPAISYVVVGSMGEPDLTNFDKWYDRDNGEIVGKHLLYRVILR